MAESFASVSEDELHVCEKCIIEQLLNSVFA